LAAGFSINLLAFRDFDMSGGLMAAQIDRAELYRLARLGAAARLNALEVERAQILKSFPGLTGGKRAAAEVRRGAAAPARGRRRQMSAAERKAVSVRMKKYWAARRKAS
jgi:hypothetical protein